MLSDISQISLFDNVEILRASLLASEDMRLVGLSSSPRFTASSSFPLSLIHTLLRNEPLRHYNLAANEYMLSVLQNERLSENGMYSRKNISK
jgi:hypothetical protein